MFLRKTDTMCVYMDGILNPHCPYDKIRAHIKECCHRDIEKHQVQIYRF